MRFDEVFTKATSVSTSGNDVKVLYACQDDGFTECFERESDPDRVTDATIEAIEAVFESTQEVSIIHMVKRGRFLTQIRFGFNEQRDEMESISFHQSAQCNHEEGFEFNPDAYIPSPDFNPDSEESLRNELAKIFEWFENNHEQSNCVSLNKVSDWNTTKILAKKFSSKWSIDISEPSGGFDTYGDVSIYMLADPEKRTVIRFSDAEKKCMIALLKLSDSFTIEGVAGERFCITFTFSVKVYN